MYQVKTRIFGNPDKGQDPNKIPYGVKPKTLSANTVDELREKVKLWQEENDIGGGNWGSPPVYKDNTFYGFMSYNARIWDRDIWSEHAKEIKDED